MPTLSAIVGQALPTDRKIDGADLTPLWKDPSAEAPNECMLYYRIEALEAVRMGDWKLHFLKNGEPLNELYNLLEDVGETTNVIDQCPEVVDRLNAFADEVRQDMGDSSQGITGKGNRKVGRVENAKALTEYNEDHPYMIAEYDLPDMPTMSG